MSLTSARNFLLLGLLQIPLTGMAAEQAHGVATPAETAAFMASTKALDLDELPDLKRIIPRLAEKRVVFIGENHDRYDHHLNQLAIIQQLHQRNPRLVIAMEFFQQPFQSYLDAYVDGALEESAFLEKTEYFDRWGYDYRLYRPIIEYAREHGIPLLALNIPGEISTKVGREGFDGLEGEERRWVPDQIDRSNSDYRMRLKRIFAQHPGAGAREFERFYEAQLLWDEAMAARAARYLKENPERQMVLLAGGGHLAYGAGIPDRLVRRVPVGTAIVLQGVEEEINKDMADFLLFSPKATLPPIGRLGVALSRPDQDVQIESVPADSAAGKAGMRPRDRILSVDGQAVNRLVDLKLALMNKKPGDSVRVRVTRQTDLPVIPEELELHVTLQ